MTKTYFYQRTMKTMEIGNLGVIFSCFSHVDDFVSLLNINRINFNFFQTQWAPTMKKKMTMMTK